MSTDKQPDQPDGAPEELKRRFREALAKKKQQSQSGESHVKGKGSSVHGAHGPAAQHREFRRKSG